jgi:hypothetical protein
MATHVKAVAGVSLLILLLQVFLAGEQAKPVPAGPIPTQILAAKKVFVANAGGEQPWYDVAQFSGGPDRAYNQLYAALKSWGRYELVGAPADADLLLEIQFICPPSVAAGNQGGDSIAGRPYDPQLRLVIRDPKTNALLWAFTERAQWAVLQGNRDKNFDQTLARIVRDLQDLSAPSESANKP